jgi:hypothetical protein
MIMLPDARSYGVTGFIQRKSLFFFKKTLACFRKIGYTLLISETSDKEISKKIMARSAERLSVDSLKSVIGLLYQRKEAGAALIRVLEKYQRGGHRPASSCSRFANSEAASGAAEAAYCQKLQRLYLRRAVVDELIRSIEAYTTLTPSVTGRLAGPSANQ